MADLSPVREEKLKEVYLSVAGGGDEGATIQDVASRMKVPQKDGSAKPMQVTPYLREMLDQCVQLGWLYKEQSIIQTGRGARMGWRYFVTPEEQQ